MHDNLTELANALVALDSYGEWTAAELLDGWHQFCAAAADHPEPTNLRAFRTYVDSVTGIPTSRLSDEEKDRFGVRYDH